MKSSLRNVLPHEIDEATEAVVLEKMRAKMRGACGMLVTIVRAMEAEFGKEAVARVARRALHRVRTRPASELQAPEADLRDFLARMERGTAGTHEWTRTEDRPDRVSYAFTRCAWAEIYRELDAADIGAWICEGDDVAARSCNPRLRCKLTRTLMQGDALCDHTFYVE